MKKFATISITFLSVCIGLVWILKRDIQFTLSSQSIKVQSSQIPEQENLRKTILNSLSNPIKGSDTAILNLNWKICGNTPEYDRPNQYESHLDNPHYIELISKKLSKSIFTQDSINKLVTGINKNLYNNEYTPNLWDSVTNKMMDIHIRAQIISKNHIKIYESHNFQSAHYSFEKDYIYNDGHWNYHLKDTISFTN